LAASVAGLAAAGGFFCLRIYFLRLVFGLFSDFATAFLCLACSVLALGAVGRARCSGDGGAAGAAAVALPLCKHRQGQGSQQGGDDDGFGVHGNFLLKVVVTLGA
jgi:hypothetical protein